MLRLIKWQINTLLNPYPIVYPFAEKSKILMWKGLTGATGNLYCGLHEFQDMGFLLHVLRPTDLFIDIGANVGSYTILASSEVGSTTISVEPIPSTFRFLQDNIIINRIQDKVESLNIGLGSKQSIIKFTQGLDTVNHVASEHESNTIDIQVNTLDNIIGNRTPILLKIDVEGFETEVLKGAQKLLIKEGLKAIIIELNGSGKRYGYNEDDIHNYLLSIGFLPYQYDPFKRSLNLLRNFGTHNTIYLRDILFIESRVKSAPKIKINNNFF